MMICLDDHRAVACHVCMYVYCGQIYAIIDLVFDYTY